MNRYTVTFWVCILIFMIVPWLTATVLSWTYTEGYEGERGEGDKVEVGEVAAIIQSSSAALYLVYILAAMILMGVVGQADSYWTYCCLVIGIPVFVAVPVVCAVILFVSAFQNPDSVGTQVGIAAAVFCLTSTSVCLCITTCALFCGTFGKGKTSRYPTPLAYLPILEKTERREDQEVEEENMYTDDYPTPIHMLPPRKSITSENIDVFLPETRRKSTSSLRPGEGPRRYSLPVGSEPRRKVSSASTFSTASDRERRLTNLRKVGSELSTQSGGSQDKSPSNKTHGTFWTRRFSKASDTDTKGKPLESKKVSHGNNRGVPRRFSTGDVQKTMSQSRPPQHKARKYSTPSFAVLH